MGDFMSQDKQKELADKKQAEERQRDQSDPMCPNCHQRKISQGCSCPPPPKKPGKQTYTGKNTGSSNNDNEKTGSKETWTQESYGSFNYQKPGLFSINVSDKGCSLTFFEGGLDFDKIREAFNKFHIDNNLEYGKDYRTTESKDGLTIQFFSTDQYLNFRDYLLNDTKGLSNELQSLLRALPKLEPKAHSKNEDDEAINNQAKSPRSSSPFSIPNPFDISSGPKKE